MAHPAYNDINIETATLENKRGARVLRIPGIGPLLSKGLTAAVLWGLQKESGKEKSKLKPLKRAENIEQMFIKDTRLRNNLRAAYPSYNDSAKYVYWLRSKEKKDLHTFTEELIRTKVSNLTLARYITRKNDEFLTLKYFVEPDPIMNNNNNAEQELYTSFPRIKDDLYSKGLITDKFAEEDFVDLLDKYYKPSEWLASAKPPSPVRLSMRKLIPMEYVHFLVTLEEVKQTSHELTDEEFTSTLREKLIQSLTLGKVKEDVLNRVVSLVENLRFPYIRVMEIPYSLLFGGKPTHIANNMGGDAPYLHHAMYLTGNIVLEQFAQLPPAENKNKSFSTYVNLKYMQDYLKAVRNSNSSVFVIPYRNPYPDEVIRRRALWTLGKYPMYDFATENCESIPSWVFENNTAEPSICRIPSSGSSPLSTSSGIQKFWNALVTQPGFASIPQFQRGGAEKKTRRLRRTGQKTRRTKPY
jgi:hypothetical protein